MNLIDKITKISFCIQHGDSFPFLKRRLNRNVQPPHAIMLFGVMMNQASSHSTISSAAFRSSGFSMMLPGTFASPATCAL